MPFLASFENIDQLPALLVALLVWAAAAGLALIALILAFWRRTRVASMWSAVASMVISLPLVWVNISLFNRGGFGLLQVSFFLAPLFVAVAVFWFNLRFLRKDRKLDQTHSENRSGDTGP